MTHPTAFILGDKAFAAIHVLQSTVACFSGVAMPAVIHALRLKGPLPPQVPGQGMAGELVYAMGAGIVLGFLWMWAAFEAWNGYRRAFGVLALLSLGTVALAAWLGPVVRDAQWLNLFLAGYALVRLLLPIGPRLANR